MKTPEMNIDEAIIRGYAIVKFTKNNEYTYVECLKPFQTGRYQWDTGEVIVGSRQITVLGEKIKKEKERYYLGMVMADLNKIK